MIRARLSAAAPLLLRTPLVYRNGLTLRTYTVASDPAAEKPLKKQRSQFDDVPLADWLLSLHSEDGKTSNDLAEEWLDAIRNLRQEYTQNGSFDVNKAFAPEGVEDFDFFANARAEKRASERSQLPETTEEMRSEFEASELSEVPEKRRTMMNMLTNHIMRNGRKNQAYKQLNRALYLVYLKKRIDPAAALLEALDAMAPLVQLHRISDGGARVETLPVPYNPTKRIGKAWKWVIESSQKRQSTDFSVRLAEEIINAIEGKGAGFDKRSGIHTEAISNRSVAERILRNKKK